MVWWFFSKGGKCSSEDIGGDKEEGTDEDGDMSEVWEEGEGVLERLVVKEESVGSECKKIGDGRGEDEEDSVKCWKGKYVS